MPMGFGQPRMGAQPGPQFAPQFNSAPQPQPMGMGMPMGMPMAMGGNGGDAFGSFTRPSVGVLMRRVFYLTALFVCETIVFGVLCTLNSDLSILQHDSRTSLPNCMWALFGAYSANTRFEVLHAN